MKKQKVQHIIMFILLVVVVVAFVGIRSYNANSEEKETPDELAVDGTEDTESDT